MTRRIVKRELRDSHGRCNANKRGPKPKDEQVTETKHTSKLRSGVTCHYSRRVITLPNGSQVLEGSLSHKQGK